MSGGGNRKTPSTATQRLKQDYFRIRKDPVPYICAEPLPSNILEWYKSVWFIQSMSCHWFWHWYKNKNERNTSICSEVLGKNIVKWTFFPECSCLEMFVNDLAHDEMFPRHFVVRGPEKSPYEGRREYFHLNENLTLKCFLYIIGLLFELISSFL